MFQLWVIYLQKYKHEFLLIDSNVLSNNNNSLIHSLSSRSKFILLAFLHATQMHYTQSQ